MLLVDSSVWIDFFNGKETWQTVFLRDEVERDQIIIGDLILCEVLQGFRHEPDFISAQELLLSFSCQTIGGREIALQAAKNYRQLRTQGITVRKTIDVFIATFCIQNKHQLLHADRDFDVMETYLNLQVMEAT